MLVKPFALLMLALLLACSRPTRAVPIEATPPPWPTVLGDIGRAGYSLEAVPADPEIEWSANVGRGLVSPLLVDGPVLTAVTGNRLVVALSTETGDHFWERRIDGPAIGGAVRLRDNVIVGSDLRGGRLYAIDQVRGRRVWERRLGMVSYAPVVVGDAVYAGTGGGSVHALDARSGEALWRRDLPGAVASTTVPVDDRLIVPTRSDSVFLLERTTGVVLERVGLPAAVSASPAVAGDRVLLPLFNGDIVALRLPSFEEDWRAPFGAPILAAPVVADDGAVFVVNRSGEVYRIPPGGRAGEKIAELDGTVRASLTLARDHLLVGRLDGTLFLLHLDGRVVWKRELDDSIVAPVTVRDGAVFVPLLRGTIVKLR